MGRGAGRLNAQDPFTKVQIISIGSQAAADTHDRPLLGEKSDPLPLG